METAREITGVILAGGQSSRFGSNKGLALWRGKFLIQHARDALAGVFTDCLLVTNTPDQFDFLNMPIICDRFRNMGPLAGIHAALRHTGKQWIFVMGCDMPGVTPELITFLCGFADNDCEAIIPWLATGPEPLCGLYHKSALDTIELQLKNNKPKVTETLERLSVRKVDEKELRQVAGSLGVFTNINRTQDLGRLK